MPNATTYFDDVVAKHFGKLDAPADWAESMARTTVAVALDNQGFFAGTNWSHEDRLAFMLATQLATGLRGLKRQAQEAETVYVDGQTIAARKKLREDFTAPDFLADVIRDAAGKLDEKGISDEANVLRDAANVIEERF